MNSIPFPTLANLPDVQTAYGLSVKAYGAKADGSADDTAAIQAAAPIPEN